MLRQVSITGLVATGMTIVILLGGIDLSVGSVMGFSTIVCAMLLTKSGWTAASVMGVPAATLVSFAAVAFLARFVFGGLARGRDVSAGQRREIVLGAWRGSRIPILFGLVVAIAVAWFTSAQVPTKFGVLGVLLVTPCVSLLLGSISGALIVAGRMQPFIATLAMMVSALGLGRLTAGQDNAVIPVYTGTNATEAFEILRSMVWGVLPMPSIFFLIAIIFFGAVLRFTTFSRYAYAIGGNLEAAKLSGIKVVQVQFTAHLVSGLLAGLAGILFVAQYRQGKPDAGSDLELDAIAAVVIGGTSLMGGRGGMGTQPAHDRHDGFHAFTDKEPGIKYLLNNQSGDWKQDQAYNIMTTALRNNEKIDLVYGHNDPMAYGAYLAAKAAQSERVSRALEWMPFP